MAFQISIEKQYIVSANPSEISREFCNLYYTFVVTKGLTSVLHMFDPNVSCNLNGIEFNGMHNVLVKFAEAGIARLNYDRITCVYQTLTNDTLLIQVTGICQGITHYNTFTEWRAFSETFVMKCYAGNKGSVVNYLFKFI